MKHIISTLVLCAAFACSSCAKDKYVIPKGSDSVPEESSVVTVVKDSVSKQWQLKVNGKPYYVNGAATNRYFTDVRKFGGNTIRLYSPASSNTRQIMDEAYQANLMVHLGLGMAAATNLDYKNVEKVAAQKEKMISYVKQYMNHPAVLCWSIGNEIEASNDDNVDLWTAVGDIAKEISELDPNHPISCTLAGSGATKLKNLVKYAPQVNLLSINAYYPTVSNIPDNLKTAGVDLPYLVTEFGPRGTWNMASEPSRILPWGDGYSATSHALVEETSYEKEEVYRTVWENDIKAKETVGCLGSLVFVWGYQTHGEVLNWYASYTTDKYSYGVCDAMQKCWTGSYPAIRAPKIEARKDMKMNGKVAEDAIVVKAGSSNTASVTASCDESVKLKYHWFIYKESDHKSDGSMPDGIEGLIKEDGSATVEFTAPAASNIGYRLYVFALDEAHQKAASACIPFFVE